MTAADQSAAPLAATALAAEPTEPTGPTRPTQRRPWAMGVFLLVTGALGWWGAMELITERIAKLIDPAHVITCDINPLISCGTVMTSWQASLLGFPNPLLGVAGFVAPMAVGVALLAGATFARWFWWLFLTGVTAAWVFVTWLFVQAVYEIGALCPWCMLVWAAVIPMFWMLLTWLLATGRLTGEGGAAQRAGRAVLPFTWVPIVVNLAGIVVAIIAQFPTLLPSLF